MKIIDISGFGHSGKTAVTNLLSEVKGLDIHYPTFEFGLLRFPDGLIDLKRNISTNWSPIKSDIALKRFKKLSNNLSESYSKNINSNFNLLTENYIDSLRFTTHQVHWFDRLYFTNNITLINVIKFAVTKLGLKTVFKFFIGLISKDTNQKKDLVNLVDSKNFDSKTKIYLENLLFSKSPIVATNNAFEPFEPSEAMSFFSESYCVIVDRDPRDIYLSSINHKSSFVPDFEKNNKHNSFNFMQNQKIDFLGSKNIENFIWRQKQLRENIKINKDNLKVIRINYEDLIYNYEDTVDYLFKKLNIDKKNHINKFKEFDPELSKINAGIHYDYKSNSNVLKIEKELSEYLYIK